MTQRPYKTNKRFVKEITRRYCDLYNREVREFYRIRSRPYSNTRGSRVHADSEIHKYGDHLEEQRARGASGAVKTEPLRDVEAEETAKLQRLIGRDAKFRRRLRRKALPFQMGAYWEGWEKRLFFRLLSRYSIHRLDEWCHMLPFKSKFEILGYYRVLKRSLQFMKNARRKTLLKRSEMQIAYEMDEEYIAIEEYLSGKLREIEESNEVATMEPKQEQEQGQNLEDEGELISLNAWQRRWHGIYRRSPIEEIKTQRKKYSDPPRLANKGELMPYLESILKKYLRALLWHTILPNMEKISMRKDELVNILDDEGQEHSLGPDVEDVEEDGTVNVRYSEKRRFLPHIITEKNVADALTMMKLEHKQCATLAESIVETIHKFELPIRPSSSKVFILKSIAQTVLPKLISQQLLQERMLNCTKLITDLDLVDGDEEYNEFVKYRRYKLLRLTQDTAARLKAESKKAAAYHKKIVLDSDGDDFMDDDEDSEDDHRLTEQEERDIAESTHFSHVKPPKTTEERFAEKCNRIWKQLRKENSETKIKSNGEISEGDEDSSGEVFPPKPFVSVKEVDYDMDTALRDRIQPVKMPKVSTRLDNPVELDLLDWETEVMEREDRRLSMMHQTALVNYLFQHGRKFVPLAFDPKELQNDPPECPHKMPDSLMTWFLRSD